MTKKKVTEITTEMTKAESKIFNGGHEMGIRRGIAAEARASLLRRFTEDEINELVNIMWLSPAMQSIKKRLAELETKDNLRRLKYSEIRKAKTAKKRG